MADVIRKMDENHTVADIDRTIDEVAQARGSSESLGTRIDGIAGQTAASDAALAELVDSGAKNILQIGTAVTAAKNGVTAVSDTDGAVTISGASTVSSQFVLINDLFSGSTSSTYGSQIPIKEGRYTIKATGIEGVRVQAINYNSSSDATTIASSDEDVDFTAAKSFIVFRLVIMPGADFSAPVTIYPMCCDSKLYAASKAYQPYRPPYQELYEMVLALQQSGTRSLSVEPSEEDMR